MSSSKLGSQSKTIELSFFFSDVSARPRPSAAPLARRPRSGAPVFCFRVGFFFPRDGWYSAVTGYDARSPDGAAAGAAPGGGRRSLDPVPPPAPLLGARIRHSGSGARGARFRRRAAPRRAARSPAGSAVRQAARGRCRVVRRRGRAWLTRVAVRAPRTPGADARHATPRTVLGLCDAAAAGVAPGARRAAARRARAPWAPGARPARAVPRAEGAAFRAAEARGGAG